MQTKRQVKTQLHPGDVFGGVIVEKNIGKKGHNQQWSCRCKCGKSFVALASNIRSGNTKSCGCLKRAVSTKMLTIHGLHRNPIWSVWKNMMRRCYEETNPAFHNYGGRGIFVCDKWHDVAAFYADMGDRPKKMSLDRIDNNKGYSPDNCRWATSKQQNRNRRDNISICIGGEKKLLVEISEETGISYDRLRARKRILGWLDERIMKDA